MSTSMTRRRAALLAASAALAGGQARASQDTVTIGHVVPLTGALAEVGRFQMNGAQLALDEVNAAGGALGRRVELVTEDSQGSNPGAVLAFSRLAGRGDIAAFLGSLYSTQTHAMAPDILKAARPMVFGGTDPALTQMGNPWLFRCRPNDLYSARAMADFGVNTLGKRRWAIVHTTEAFGAAGMRALVAALEKLGVTPALVQGFTAAASDLTPVALAVKQSGADLIAGYIVTPNDVALFARQVRQVGVETPWIGSPSITASTTLNLAGPALFGTYGVTDFSAGSSPEAAAFADRYAQRFGATADPFSAWPYDGLRLLVRAIETARSTEPEAVRKALLAIEGFKGAEGEYDFDANGDGLHGYNVVKNDAGKLTFIRHVEFRD
ncbi:MAG: ABC transporter substrate-binding protein [Acetobacteraceae bacterium]|nr:ABC transporter substrate-binding protein [Acetobacteraceae bacterium]